MLFLKVNNETWIVGEKRLEELMVEIKVEKLFCKEKTVKGKELEGKRYIHPLLDADSWIKGMCKRIKLSHYSC